jgi:hypothetical protein
LINEMKLELAKAAGGTGLRPVQFGVTPDCGDARATAFAEANIGSASPSPVSGATPETTGGTPVPPDLL